jgi:NAD(P)H-flavin reductase
LRIELPLGTFSLAGSDRPLVFVAGGTGFAPIKSILDDLAKRGDSRSITLYWGARTADGLYLPTALEKWRKQLPGFRYVTALSDAPSSAEEGAFRGFVCCGSPPMVQAVRNAAIGLGLAHEDFHSDVFVSGPLTKKE